MVGVSGLDRPHEDALGNRRNRTRHRGGNGAEVAVHGCGHAGQDSTESAQGPSSRSAGLFTPAQPLPITWVEIIVVCTLR
jgi:hypothetical protein